MTILTFRSRRPLPPEQGINYAQAMNIAERFFKDSEAAPTIVTRTRIPLDTVIAVLDGKLWPQVKAHWLGQVFGD